MSTPATPSNNIPLEDVEVGHAGLYVPEKNDTADQAHEKIVNALGTITDTITPDIELGIAKGAKTLIDCETGIKAFVKDELATPTDNGLPNSETGVWIHYLTLGIERDFGRSWEKDPKALNGREYNYEKQSSAQKKASSGKRVITKAEKNDLLMKSNWTYWMPMISAGKMSMEEGMKEFQQVAEKIQELENLGITLSENKTAGVLDYNVDRAVIDVWGGNWEALDILQTYKIKILIPNIIENFFTSRDRLKTSIMNAALGCKQLMLGVYHKGKETGYKSNMFSNYETKAIKDKTDLWEQVPEFYKAISTGKHSSYEIKSIHIGKTKTTGNDKCLIVDGLDIKSSKRILFVLDSSDGITTIYDDVWYNNEEVIKEMEF